MADFNATMAVHPTAGEEWVTFGAPTERIRGGEVVGPEAGAPQATIFKTPLVNA